jgi:hypothetical protein
MSERPFRTLSGEALKKAQRKADNDIALHVARLRAHDKLFKLAIDRGIALDEEADHRRKP